MIGVLRKSILRKSRFVYVKLHLAFFPFNWIYIMSNIIAANKICSIWPIYIFYLSIMVSSYQLKSPFLDIPWKFVPLKFSLCTLTVFDFWWPWRITSSISASCNSSKHSCRAIFHSVVYYASISGSKFSGFGKTKLLRCLLTCEMASHTSGCWCLWHSDFISSSIISGNLLVLGYS